MDKQNFNLDEVKESSYISKEGKYTLTVKAFTSGESQANHTEYHKFDCESADGEKISVTLYLVENAMWKYKAFVKACGLSATGIVNLDNLSSSLVGKKFIGEVKKQPDKVDIVTGEKTESKFFEVAKFHTIEG